jgi:uncharacterized membrane protein HdeD (DUF308 family)
VPLARAVPALVLGLVITFSSDHSAAFGLIAFGIFALVTGAVLVAAAIRHLFDAAARTLFLIQGVVTLLAGVAAIVLPSGGTPYLIWVVSAWAILAGALELVNGIRLRRTASGARDWLLTGALTLLLACAVLVVPPGLAQEFTGPDEVTRVLTAAIMVVGLIGAWAVIVGVQLGIAAIPPRAADPADSDTEQTTVAS